MPTIGVRRGHRDMAFLPVHIAVTTLVALAGLTAIELRLYESPLSYGPVTIVSSLAVLGLIAYARYFVGLSWLSASVVYLLLFWTFHFGMTFTTVLFPDVLLKFEDWQLEWLAWPNVRVGMLLGVIGAAGFLLGSGLFAKRPSVSAPEAGDREWGIYVGGWLIMLGGIGSSWLFVALNVGTAVFAEGYLSFLALSGSTMARNTPRTREPGLSAGGLRSPRAAMDEATGCMGRMPGAARAGPGGASRSDDRARRSCGGFVVPRSAAQPRNVDSGASRGARRDTGD